MIHTRMSCCNRKSLRKVKFLFLSVPFTWKYTSCGKLLKNTFQWHYSGWRKNVSIPSEKTNPLCAVEEARGTSESDSESNSQDVQTKSKPPSIKSGMRSTTLKRKITGNSKREFSLMNCEMYYLLSFSWPCKSKLGAQITNSIYRCQCREKSDEERHITSDISYSFSDNCHKE